MATVTTQAAITCNRTSEAISNLDNPFTFSPSPATTALHEAFAKSLIAASLALDPEELMTIHGPVPSPALFNNGLHIGGLARAAALKPEVQEQAFVTLIHGYDLLLKSPQQRQPVLFMRLGQQSIGACIMPVSGVDWSRDRRRLNLPRLRCVPAPESGSISGYHLFVDNLITETDVLHAAPPDPFPTEQLNAHPFAIPELSVAIMGRTAIEVALTKIEKTAQTGIPTAGTKRPNPNMHNLFAPYELKRLALLGRKVVAQAATPKAAAYHELTSPSLARILVDKMQELSVAYLQEGPKPTPRFGQNVWWSRNGNITFVSTAEGLSRRIAEVVGEVTDQSGLAKDDRLALILETAYNKNLLDFMHGLGANHRPPSPNSTKKQAAKTEPKLGGRTVENVIPGL